MDASVFIKKWKKVDLRERSAAQQHFLDLCELVGHSKPAELDPTGESFTFERGASIHDGGEGWADVWKRNFFGWEYKGKHHDLNAAYNQLLRYREALENPPLLVVCDMDIIKIHTNFTNTTKRIYEIKLHELDTPRNLEILRNLFFDPEKLRPGYISVAITIEAARCIGEIAQSMRTRGLAPQAVAHFLDRCIFCLFAEDVDLLPVGSFSGILMKSKDKPLAVQKKISTLFTAMADGGDYGNDDIRHFNGNLFNNAEVLELSVREVADLLQASGLNWSAVDASIFGTLFERGLDPAKRAQLGAHYTSRADIEVLVEPVVMAPLRREWAETRAVLENLLKTGKKTTAAEVADTVANGQLTLSAPAKKKAQAEVDILLHRFLTRLQQVKVLDPACGSGNFLFVTLQMLKNLEKEVLDYALAHDITDYRPAVGPWQLYGIEINLYAYDLAQMTIWIGYLQWMRNNGYHLTDSPVLRPMENNFFNKDAIIDLTDPANPREAEWPRVDYVVGNPPFLGGNRIRKELGDEYVNTLFQVYKDKVPATADLCCYWFENALHHLQNGIINRVGLLATQGIRGGANREVLNHIKENGDIFFAVSDKEWELSGANVHISMVGFDMGEEILHILDGVPVNSINPNLTTNTNVTTAIVLTTNLNICYMGPSPKGPFDIAEELALSFLMQPNPHLRPNSDVVRPVISATDIGNGHRAMWTIDFAMLPAEMAAFYEAPFKHLETFVYPIRSQNNRQAYAEKWWQYAEARPGMRDSLAPLARFIVTPGISKHRLFVWKYAESMCNQGTHVFARSDDFFFGVLHSRVHELWARAMGTQLRERESGFRYTPTSCFETFPLPLPTEEQREAIAVAARELDALRNNWLKPREWVVTEMLEFPGSQAGPWARYITDADANGIGTVRYPRLAPRDSAHREMLAKRTLTNLYNQRPAWLDNAHRQLDAAVCAAYGWAPDISDDELLTKLLALNSERAQP